MNVYWTAYTQFDTVGPFKFNEPYPVTKAVNDAYPDLDAFNSAENFHLCPAFKDHFANTFELRFPNNYNFHFEGDQVRSSNYDQKYWDEMVMVRAPRINLYSYRLRYLFFCEESLEMSLEPAYFSETEFAKNTMFCAGKFNIGRWFRATDCTFFVKQGVKDLFMMENEPFCYAKFHTDKKINFKRFYRTDKIKQLHQDMLDAREFRAKKVYPLAWFYSLFQNVKVKSLLLDEIKSNLME